MFRRYCVNRQAVSGDNYSWISKPTGFTSTLANPVVKPIFTTTYFLTVTNSSGIMARDSVTITVSSSPMANAGVDQTICSGDSITIGTPPSSNNTYSWTSNPAGFASSEANPKVLPVLNTTYYLNVTNSNGCSSKDTVVLMIKSLSSSSVAITASDTIICSGKMVLFTAIPANGGNSPSYQWQVNGVNSGTNTNTFSSSSFNNNDIISVIMTSSAQCLINNPVKSNSVVMKVNVTTSPLVSISASSATICEGSNVTFTATPVNGGTSPVFQWQVNGVNAGTNSSTFSSSTLKNLDVVKVIMTSSNSCAAVATSNNISMTVTGVVTPTVSIVASSTNICLGTGVTFTATSVNGGNSPIYQWEVNGVTAGNNSNTFTTSSLKQQ